MSANVISQALARCDRLRAGQREWSEVALRRSVLALRVPNLESLDAIAPWPMEHARGRSGAAAAAPAAPQSQHVAGARSGRGQSRGPAVHPVSKGSAWASQKGTAAGKRSKSK